MLFYNRIDKVEMSKQVPNRINKLKLPTKIDLKHRQKHADYNNVKLMAINEMATTTTHKKAKAETFLQY